MNMQCCAQVYLKVGQFDSMLLIDGGREKKQLRESARCEAKNANVEIDYEKRKRVNLP